MYELYPYFTNDGSVGLFSPEADDIYHSTYGALTEAYEKFIIPADIKNYVKNNSEIKVLDICFGIGYNTKSFLNEIINFQKNEKNIYNGAIDTDNINCNDKIDTNNVKRKIFVKAIDTDKNLALLSPFFITGKKNVKNNKLSFSQEKIERMLSGKTVQRFKLNPEVNILLLEKLYARIDAEILALLNTKKYKSYFDPSIRRLNKFLISKGYKYTLLKGINAFLHNIYYRYLSKGYKKALNTLKTLDFNFELEIDDARRIVKNDKNKYNFIFLDAFTPVKCPCLWTVDFFKLLYEHLEDDGIILTYSNSALVRNAFLNAGFYVYKIYSESANKFTGTVAGKNSLSTKNDKIFELSEYDLGLMKTKAGIFYRDKNLDLTNEAINTAHKIEVENSDLLSSSKFIKEHKKKISIN